MPDLSRRSAEPEIMDDLTYAGPLMDRTLLELEIINKWLGGNSVTLDALQKLLRGAKGEITIADLGCGRGDMLRLIDLWASKNKMKVSLFGIDANTYIINAAKENLRSLPHIRFHDIDILSAEFKTLRFDVVIGTLFYHHFSDADLIQFFRQLKDQAGIGFIINDIHRHPLAYHSIRILTRFFSKSSMVRFDAPLSVRRAFSKAELFQILNAAGVRNFDIRWKWAFRWQVVVYN